MWGREAADPLERLQHSGLLSKGGRQAWHHFGRPGILYKGERLWRNKTVGIMVVDQHGVLL